MVILFLHGKRIPVWTMPDISVTYRISMILEPKVTGLSLASSHFHIVLDQNAIMQNCVSTFTNVFPLLILNGGMYNDIIGLPNTWSPACINQGRVAVIDRSCLTMRIS
jgi:hypothetical protein